MRDYMKSFYNDDDEIQRAMLVKEAHTGRVREIAKELAGHLSLSEEDTALAELMALLHDIGRFRQFTVYRTFNDAQSEDHAALGLAEIRDNDLLAGLLPWEQELVRFAIARHNKKEIGPAPNRCALGYARFLRDADKLDIYHVLEPYLSPSSGGGISPDFVEKFVNGVQCDYTMIATEDDKKLVRLMWVYDINFAWTLKRVMKHDYIEKVIRFLPDDERLVTGVERLRAYALRKCEERDDIGFVSSRECETRDIEEM